VIVKHPQRPGVDFVQRIIGLPGEQVQVRNGEVLINGRALQRSPVEGDRTGAIANARYYLETTPEGRGYKILDLNENSPLDNTPLQTVPQGYYWSLGNNRDNAIDSRMTAQFGLVPAANIYRKPVVIFWSKDRSRIGRKVE
jgi:signal peptidase I